MIRREKGPAAGRRNAEVAIVFMAFMLCVYCMQLPCEALNCRSGDLPEDRKPKP